MATTRKRAPLQVAEIGRLDQLHASTMVTNTKSLAREFKNRLLDGRNDLWNRCSRQSSNS